MTGIDLGPLLLGILAIFVIVGVTLGFGFGGMLRGLGRVVQQGGESVEPPPVVVAGTPGDADFLPLAREIFVTVAQALAGHRLGDVSRLLTPALFESLTAEAQASGGAPAQASVVITEAALIDASHDAGRQSRTVWFTAALGGAGLPGQITQYWTFERNAPPPGSGPEPVEAERRCANCGAPLGAGVSGVCPYCHEALVGDAEGWLVAAIAGAATGDPGADL